MGNSSVLSRAACSRPCGPSGSLTGRSQGTRTGEKELSCAQGCAFALAGGQLSTGRAPPPAPSTCSWSCPQREGGISCAPPFPSILGKPREEQAAGTGRGAGVPPGAHGGVADTVPSEGAQRGRGGRWGGSAPSAVVSLLLGCPPGPHPPQRCGRKAAREEGGGSRTMAETRTPGRREDDPLGHRVRQAGIQVTVQSLATAVHNRGGEASRGLSAPR